MADLIMGAAFLCVVFAIAYALWERRRTAKTIERMELMIDAAVNGTFCEQDFDESMLSRLESSLAAYLSANEVSARNLTAEKDKIKTLISDISHQTKTPISNLLLYTELLKEQEMSGEARDYVAQLHAQSEKLSFLITALVKISRLETGILVMRPKVRRVPGLLKGVEAEYAPHAAAKGLKLMVESSIEVQAVYDEKWTAEALGNIVDNAIKYTDSGCVRVRVKPYELFVCIEVEDTGPGISEQELGAIWGRFYRSPKVQGKEGLGIGLFLAREIISGQGGYIKVKSKPGKGSVFSLYLPAVEQKEEPEAG